MKKKYLIMAITALLLSGCSPKEVGEAMQEKLADSTATEESKEEIEETEETSTQSEEEYENEKQKYIEECQPFQYKEFFRYEDKYKGTKVSLVLEVAQVMEDGLRCYSYTGDSLSLGDEYVIIDDRVEKDMRILEDDTISVWGEYIGSANMTRAISDVAEDIPAVSAKYIELIDETDGMHEETTGGNPAEEAHAEIAKETNIDTTNPMVKDIFDSEIGDCSWQSYSTGYYLIPFLDSGEYQIWFTSENDTIWANTAFTMDVTEIENTSSGGIICRGNIYEAVKENPPYVGVAEVTWHSQETIDFCSVKLIDGHQFSDVSMVADDYSYHGIVGQDYGQSYAGNTSQPEYMTMYVVNCNESITLRTEPSTSASEICQIPLGAAVSYISSASNGFYQISYLGHTGYALASYLSEEDPGSDTLYTTMRVVNCRESITLRTSPSTAAAEICQIPLGATVSYIEVAANGFYKIVYLGRTGYALASYLEFE